MPEVQCTQDFERVRDLPRRRLDPDVAAEWAADLTPMLRAPGSARTLQPWQAWSLVEIVQNGGAFLALPVGAGKTDITFLAPTMLQSLRSVVIVPGAGLRDKTNYEFGLLRSEWIEPPTPTKVVTWQELTVESAADYFERTQPQLIMIDEADEAANPDASWVRRIDRYVLAHPEVVVVLLTGTPGRKSIMNYWHLLGWALRERMPMPLSRVEAQTWALAIDEARRRNQSRVRPGVLGGTVELARAWYRTRLAETPGVVIVDGDSCAAPLTLRVRLAAEDPGMDAVFQKFLTDNEAPGGEVVMDPLSRWRVDGQLGCGMVLYYDPAPPPEWRLAARAMGAFTRERIAHSTRSRTPLDTEGMVINRYRDHPVVREWLRVKDTFKGVTKARWFSDSTIYSAQQWLAESDAPGIIWTGCVEFAESLAIATRLSYYGPKGRDQAGRRLHVADPSQNIICSWNANKKGFNLQPWTRQLLVMPPSSAKWLEQVFGRSHRGGQENAVTIDFLATSGATLDLFETAIGEAGFARETIGMTQKILRANIVRAAPRVTDSNRFRWARGKGDARDGGSIEVSFGT